MKLSAGEADRSTLAISSKVLLDGFMFLMYVN